MTKAQRTATTWSASSSDELLEHVRGALEADGPAVRATWAAVAEDAVLAGRVRGALSRLKAEHRGHRDEAVWLLRITRAARQLATPAPSPAPAPRPAEPEPEVRLTVVPEIAQPRRPAVPALLFREPEPLAAS
ncbi:hypothetical protein [Saccharothrix sp. Mg75]|uniref:hypothetical protein n=1 Tax=Saccharothrix sp. Mg75 TaxID=3445357 RepID=UPI003EE9DAF9